VKAVRLKSSGQSVGRRMIYGGKDDLWWERMIYGGKDDLWWEMTLGYDRSGTVLGFKGPR